MGTENLAEEKLEAPEASNLTELKETYEKLDQRCEEVLQKVRSRKQKCPNAA